MTNPVTFSLPMPPSVNALYTNNSGKGKRGRAKSQRYLSWITEAGIELNRQRVPTLTPPYSIEYAVGRPDKRKRDVANLEKPLSDLLVSMDVIEDDSLIDDNRQRWCPKVPPGMVHCTVESL